MIGDFNSNSLFNKYERAFQDVLSSSVPSSNSPMYHWATPIEITSTDGFKLLRPTHQFRYWNSLLEYFFELCEYDQKKLSKLQHLVIQISVSPKVVAFMEQVPHSVNMKSKPCEAQRELLRFQALLNKIKSHSIPKPSVGRTLPIPIPSKNKKRIDWKYGRNDYSIQP